MKRPDRRFREYTIDGGEGDFADYCEDEVVEMGLFKAPILEAIRRFKDLHILTSLYYWKLFIWARW